MSHVSHNQLAASIAVLRLAYPRQDFPDASVAFYVRQLADLDAAAVEAAVDRLTKRSTWLPSIAEIRVECAEAACGLPSAAEAWSLMLDSPFDDWPDVLRDTVRACGGRWSLVHNDRATVARAQFVADYEARRSRAINVEAGADPLPQGMIESLTIPVAEIPESTSIVPRPVYARWLRRQMHKMNYQDLPAQIAFPPPSDVEKHDAILVLRDANRNGGHADAVEIEAQRIMDEASA